MTWSATKKEVERSNFFKEGPKILKRFWFSLLVSSVVIVGVVIVATPLVPIQWRIGGEGLRVNTSEHIETPSPLFVCIWHGHFSHIVAVPWVL